MVTFRTSVVCIGALLVLSCSSCRRSQQSNKEIAELAALGTSLNALSFDLGPILATGRVTTIAELKRDYELRYTNRPPLFVARPFAYGVLRNSEYELPQREYFMLQHWNTNDAPTIPLFWSFFHTPRPVVEYICIDGTEHVCASNDFYPLFLLVSNRVSRVNQVK
jgi:hypothetical protein